MSGVSLFVWIVLAAVGLTLVTLLVSRFLIRVDETAPKEKVLGMYSPILTWLKYRRLSGVHWRSVNLKNLPFRIPLSTWQAILEAALIVGWAMWVGRALLDFDPYTWPHGTGIGGNGLSNYFWTDLQRCGTCAFWRGSLEGGVPALADRFGAPLHPYVMISTLLWGVMAGMKVALVASLATAGLAQWWLARTLRLGWQARLWSALLAVTGGNLAVQLDEGNVALILTIACSYLAFAAAIAVGVNHRRRDTLRLAVAGALVILSAGGYLQFGLACMAPAFLFFLLDRQLKWRAVWKEYVLAVGLSLLLCGIWLAPTAHFWPNFLKETSSPQFEYAQPLGYIVLNLVIRDANGWATMMGAHPGMNATYIGWTPVILAVLCLKLARREDHPVLWNLAVVTGLMFFIGSAVPLRFLAQWIPFLQSFRFVSVLTVLTIPAVLGLAAYGLDALLRLNWPRLGAFSTEAQPARLSFDTRWLLAIGLFFSISDVYKFSQGYYDVRDMKGLYTTVQALKTPTLEWAAQPYGSWDGVQPVIDEDMKIAHFFSQVVGWAGREAPKPHIYVADGEQPPEAIKTDKQINGAPIYIDPRNEYAAVVFENGTQMPCPATGWGGNLTVICSTDRPGKLVVQENSWSGWRVWLDGKPVNLNRPTPAAYWLSTAAPAGVHSYVFRYQPWDVWVGLAITLVGIGTWAVLWWRTRSRVIE